MADLSDLKNSAVKAIEACQSAPFIVRQYLGPLIQFIDDTVTAVDEINDENEAKNAERQKWKEAASRILSRTPTDGLLQAVAAVGGDPDDWRDCIEELKAAGRSPGTCEEKET